MSTKEHFMPPQAELPDDSLKTPLTDPDEIVLGQPTDKKIITEVVLPDGTTSRAVVRAENFSDSSWNSGMAKRPTPGLSVAVNGEKIGPTYLVETTMRTQNERNGEMVVYLTLGLNQNKQPVIVPIDMRPMSAVTAEKESE